MRKIMTSALVLTVITSCSKNATASELKAKNKTIDSLKIELRDCKSQAQIMAEVMEFERLDEQKKNATK
ncbi:hypothetical protein GCM10009120_14020 [Sphingobacterium siyangense subsp. cladoniae]|uniref:hypothetical protein n=1 Tax=Sphingobacterium siyangense TaxID=459529 RepID=UPI0031F895E7